jgi:signal transduction histidine kinase
MKRSIKILIIFFIVSISVYGNEVDSLKKLLPNADTKQRAIIYNEMAKTYEKIAPESRIKYANEALRLARRIGFDSSIAAGYKNLGIGYYYKNDNDSSIYFFKIALEKYTQIKDTLGMSACLNNLGILYSQRDDFDKVTEYYLKSLKIKEQQKDSAGMAKVYNNLGNFHFRFKRFDKALNYFNKSLTIHKKIIGDSIFIPLSYMNIANVYRLLGSQLLGLENSILNETQYEIVKGKKDSKTIEYFNNALDYYNKAVDGFLNFKDTANYYRTLSLKSQVFIFMGDLEKAKDGLLESYNYFSNSDDIYSFSELASALGSYYLFSKDYLKAIKFFEESINSKPTKYNSSVMLSSQNLAQALYKLGRYKESFEILMQANNIRDSLDIYKEGQKFIELESKYQSEKKDKRILLLEKDKEIMAGERNILFLSLLLLVAVLVIIFIFFRSKQKLNTVLNQKNKELEITNQKLTESQYELKQANDAKDKFFSIMAHDLRNPISAFKQVTEVITEDFDSFDEKEKKEFLEDMKLSSNLLYNLLENLLTWSRSQRGAIEANPATNDIYSIAELTISHLKSQSERKSIELINNIPLDTKAFFDLNLTSTIIRNLISNSIKFSYEGSKIEVNIKDDNNIYIVQIKDYGIGMEKDAMEKLFRIDQTISNNGTKGESGTGLGLIICKEFSEKQNGKIWVESKIGKGSSFYFTLPKSIHNFDQDKE